MKLFDQALEEYSVENDDGKHKLIYAYFGLAVYIGQCLEETFSFMLWANRICSGKVKTNKEINEIIDGIEGSKKTMGKFIYEVKQTYDLSDQIEEKLASVLDKRNVLVHRYFKYEIQKFYSELGHKEMLSYFCTFIDEAKRVDEELRDISSIYYEKLGISDDVLANIMNDMKQEELKRQEKENGDTQL